jgi:hypothetical protein
LIGAAAQMGLICARPAWLTLLTDVSALPRVARLGIMHDVFPLVGRRPHPDRSTYRLPPAPPAPG